MIFIEFLRAAAQPSAQEKNTLLDDKTLQKWLSHYPVLHIEYDALCRSLCWLLTEIHHKNQEGQNIDIWLSHLKNTLANAMRLNQLLIKTYEYTGIHSKTQAALKQHQEKLIVLQTPNVAQTKSSVSPSELNISPIKEKLPFFAHLKAWWANLKENLNDFRVKTSRGNPRRLFFSRLRRGFLNIKTILADSPEHLNNFNRGYSPLDLVFGWAMNILSWLFLLPRLLINLYYTAWHVLPHKGLSEEERQLKWTQRLKLQWKERKWEFANELLWVPGGVLTCFILVGTLGMIGVYLTVALFLWDVLVSAVRAHEELGRLSKVIELHQTYLTQLGTTEEKTLHQQFINQLLAHQTYERKRHALSIVNNSLAALFTFLALSCIMLPAIVPLIASGCILILTIFTVVMGNKVSDTKPNNPVGNLSTESYQHLQIHLPQHVADPSIKGSENAETPYEPQSSRSEQTPGSMLELYSGASSPYCIPSGSPSPSF